MDKWSSNDVLSLLYTEEYDNEVSYKTILLYTMGKLQRFKIQHGRLQVFVIPGTATCALSHDLFKCQVQSCIQI